MITILIAVLVGALQDPTPDEAASQEFKDANEAFQRGDFAAADAGYARILKEWPRTTVWGRALYNLGFSLMKQKRYAEARAEFEKLLKADVNDGEPGDHIMELRRNYRPKAIAHIGECYEAEGNWEKALEAYQDQGRYPMNTGCGNCNASVAIQAQSRIARALVGLGRDQEAMKVVRKILFKDGALGGPSPEMAILAVDLAVRGGTSDEFARELEQLKGGNGTVARDYLRVLRLRAASDHEGLYELIRLRAVSPNQNNWEDARKRTPIGVEALECLGELGDPALDWVIEKFRASPADRVLALTAIAHFKNARALEFIRAVPVRPQVDDPSLLRMLERIHAAPSRQRTYPVKAMKAQDLGMGVSGVLMSVLVILGFVRKFARRRASA